MRDRNPTKKNTALRRKEKKQKTFYFKKMQQNEMNDKKRKNCDFYEKKVENKRRNFHHRLKKYFNTFSAEIFWETIEAVVWRCSIEKVFLDISQNSQGNTWAKGLFLNKDAVLRPTTLLKKRLWHRCLPWILRNFWEHLFLKNTSAVCFWNKTFDAFK